MYINFIRNAYVCKLDLFARWVNMPKYCTNIFGTKKYSTIGIFFQYINKFTNYSIKLFNKNFDRDILEFSRWVSKRLC